MEGALIGINGRGIFPTIFSHNILTQTVCPLGGNVQGDILSHFQYLSLCTVKAVA